LDEHSLGASRPEPTRDEQHLTIASARAALRNQRVDDLVASCREQTLQQLIGPFGLTRAIFNDTAGGNVTTQHNAEQGIFAKESERYDRSDYDYQQARRRKTSEAVSNGSMNSQEFTDGYTGQKAQTKRTNENGKLALNAELDHTIPLTELHRNGGWIKDREGRSQIASAPGNLHFTTHETNRRKGGRPAEQALCSENGFDSERIEPIIASAREAVDTHMPTTGERVIYHGKEIAKTGGVEFGKNGLRRALGVLLVEFANGTYLEISAIMRERLAAENAVDRIIEGMRRTLERVQAKLGPAVDAFLAGGVQGFVSNLLTFIINSVVTTSAKVVSIIRESIQAVWEALKLVIAPPPGTPPLEVARAATKLIAAAVTTALGMLVEVSVKGFVATIPVLAPIADGLSTAVTGILTGVATAMTIYAVDRLFDWLSASSTEFLQLKVAAAEAQGELVERVAAFIAMQYEQSCLYATVAEGYERIRANLQAAVLASESAVDMARRAVDSRDAATRAVPATIASFKAMDAELDRLLLNFYGANEA
jgi:hypothetical protein